MTQEEVKIIFEMLKEIKKDVSDLKQFKNFCLGGFWTITAIGALVYFVIRVVEVIY